MVVRMKNDHGAMRKTLADIASSGWWLWSFVADDGNRPPTCKGPPAARRVGMYLAGCLLFSLGVKLFIDAGEGVDPLHAMAIGIVDRIHLPVVGVGVVVSAITIAFLVRWSLWRGKFPPLATFLTMALVGFLVDAFNLAGLERMTQELLTPTPMMLTGLLLDAYGSALIIMSGIGVRIMDLVAIAARKRYRCSFLTAKMAIETGFVLVALLVGGPIGLATLAFMVLVAPAVPTLIWFNGRVLRLPNHGLVQARPVLG